MSIAFFYVNIFPMKVIFPLIILALFILLPEIASAKVLPRYAKSSGKTVKRNAASSVPGISVSAKLKGDKSALNVSFSNLQNARQVSYTFMYQTDGKDEGVSGSIDASSGNTTRELLFGTCSSGVCRYHTNITNMRLEVVSELLSGKKTVKRFSKKRI